jgi:hypothetical protein
VGPAVRRPCSRCRSARRMHVVNRDRAGAAIQQMNDHRVDQGGDQRIGRMSDPKIGEEAPHTAFLVLNE